VGKALNGMEEGDLQPTKRSRAQPTARQHQVIQLLAQGKVNKEVASILNISVRTAETHRAKIMLKFGFHSLADLVLYAIREGMVTAQVVSAKAKAAKTGNR
jgi:DNA-binding NarL/FixJ family response regulator